MAGKYQGYYNREGKGKRKKYRCRLCNHKPLPTLSGITSHLSRTHDEEIEANERKAREWKEDRQRKKQEEIEQERRLERHAKQQLREYAAMIPQIKEQNKLKKEAEQKRIERDRKICLAMEKAHENGESWGNVLRIYYGSLIEEI